MRFCGWVGSFLRLLKTRLLRQTLDPWRNQCHETLAWRATTSRRGPPGMVSSQPPNPNDLCLRQSHLIGKMKGEELSAEQEPQRSSAAGPHSEAEGELQRSSEAGQRRSAETAGQGPLPATSNQGCRFQDNHFLRTSDFKFHKSNFAFLPPRSSQTMMHD